MFRIQLQGRAAGALLRASVKEGPAQSAGMTNDKGQGPGGLGGRLGVSGFCPRSVGSAGGSLTIKSSPRSKAQSQEAGCFRPRQGLELFW